MTDNSDPALEGYPPQGELDERVHHFRFSLAGDSLQSEHVNLFGDISGEGVLHKVESIYADPAHNRLLIADEAFNQRSVKVYDLAGNFTGEVIPSQYFTSEPEGIALYSCPDGSGYWIMTDQHESDDNKFQVFDRQTLDLSRHLQGRDHPQYRRHLADTIFVWGFLTRGFLPGP
ncbi:MAG: hypothetical protein U5K69_11830 [Balneolaceae bacterium]|nr:hypothetical protein [Balneolaceae bacterium]